MKAVFSKTKFLGNFIKFSHFSPPIHFGFSESKKKTYKKTRTRTGRAKEASGRQKRTRLLEIAMCNEVLAKDGYLKFVTFKPRAGTRDLKKFNQDFKKFIQRFNYRFGIKAVYIACPEKHDSERTSDERRGTYHMHAIFFNVPLLGVSLWEEIYGLGFCDVRGVKLDEGHIVMSYLLKYVTKDNMLNSRVLMPRHILRPDFKYNTAPPIGLKMLNKYSTLVRETNTTITTALYKTYER